MNVQIRILESKQQEPTLVYINKRREFIRRHTQLTDSNKQSNNLALRGTGSKTPLGISVAVTYRQSLQVQPIVHLFYFVMAIWNLIPRRLFALGHVSMSLEVPMTDITPKQRNMRKEHFCQGKSEHYQGKCIQLSSSNLRLSCHIKRGKYYAYTKDCYFEDHISYEYLF